MYIETRSTHALIIDRAKRARQIHKDFVSPYKQAPNQSDVENYDDYKLPPKKAQLPKKAEKEKYEPTEVEKRIAYDILLKQPVVTTMKDLQRTKNVVNKKQGFDTWKKNPKYYDLHGVDTQPEELISERINTVQRITQVPVKFSNRQTMYRKGSYRYQPLNKTDKGKITINNKGESLKSVQRITSHELGHAYDRNILGKTKERRTLNTGNFSFFNPKAPKQHLKMKEAVKKISPWKEGRNYSYDKYRNSTEELFADWFSGLITKKHIVKKTSKQAYNTFKKQNKDLFKELKKSDKKVIDSFLKKINNKKI
jgi:hypothetical protein